MLLHSTRKFPTVHHEGSTRCSALARTGARRPGRRCLCLAQPSPSEAWQRFVDGVAAASATASAALKRELDFEAWAPRSSRAWRLRELPAELSRPDAEKGRTESTGVDDDWADVPLPASALRAAVERSADSALTGAELRALCEVRSPAVVSHNSWPHALPSLPCFEGQIRCCVRHGYQGG